MLQKRNLFYALLIGAGLCSCSQREDVFNEEGKENKQAESSVVFQLQANISGSLMTRGAEDSYS